MNGKYSAFVRSMHNVAMIARKALFGLIGLALVVGVVATVTWKLSRRFQSELPPVSSSVLVVRPLPDVLVAVRGLSRLESVSYHMERIIDLTDKQSRFFGLIESEDAVLLVAAANVTAGVDLQKLQAGAIEVDRTARKVRIMLPDPEILSSGLDNQYTYVHSRKTGVFAQRREDLETRARAEAERTLLDAALQAGILESASRNAERAVEALLRSLGFVQIEVVGTSVQKGHKG